MIALQAELLGGGPEMRRTNRAQCCGLEICQQLMTVFYVWDKSVITMIMQQFIMYTVTDALTCALKI